MSGFQVSAWLSYQKIPLCIFSSAEKVHIATTNLRDRVKIRMPQPFTRIRTTSSPMKKNEVEARDTSDHKSSTHNNLRVSCTYRKRTDCIIMITMVLKSFKMKFGISLRRGVRRCQIHGRKKYLGILNLVPYVHGLVILNE